MQGNSRYAGLDLLVKGSVVYYPKARRGRRIKVKFNDGKYYTGEVFCNDFGSPTSLPGTKIKWDDGDKNVKPIKLEDGDYKFI